MLEKLFALDRKGFTGRPFALEISVAIILKVLVLWLLWSAFFSAPQAKKMRLPTAQVAQHLLTTQSSTTAENGFKDPTAALTTIAPALTELTTIMATTGVSHESR